MSETPSSSNSFSIGRVAGWSIYLGMSWTWCIGMFLPVLIMRELGIAGAIAFAIPNVLGAAAMGWIIRSRETSQEMVRDNRLACVWFSMVTIAFHAFFAAWMIRRIAGPNAGLDLVAVFLTFWLILHWKRGGPFLAAAVALAISVFVMAWGFWRGDLPYLAHPVEGTRLPQIDNLWLAPAWIFGFLLCPYLDLTFHAARQGLSRLESRGAFSIGFGILFALMLVFTVAYSGHLAIGFDRARYPQLAFILSAHLIVQSCLTCALHVRQIRQTEPRLGMKQFLAFCLFLIVAVMLGIWDHGQFTYNRIAMGEIIYRVFIGFYGLFAPAYVWLRMVKPRRSMLRVWTVVVIAAPLFWLGFANEIMPFMVPGVLIVFLAKFVPEPQAMAG